MTNTILFFGLSQNLDLIKYFKRFNNKVIIIDNKKKKNIIYSDLKNIKKTFNKIKKKKLLIQLQIKEIFRLMHMV